MYAPKRRLRPQSEGLLYGQKRVRKANVSEKIYNHCDPIVPAVYDRGVFR